MEQRFIPSGLADGSNQNSNFDGSCKLLQNLIFDRVEHRRLIARPAVTSGIVFSPTFSSPGVISASIVIGSRVYGLIATSRNAGNDEPFCYDFSTAAFITISGVTSGNTPATPSTTGDWIPPTMAAITSKILVSHPGFSGANKLGWFDLANPASPAWAAGNTTPNGITGIATSVSNFNNRGYITVGNTAFITDSLLATTITNATQNIQLSASTDPITAGSGLPLTTGTQGILQSLILFKANETWQVTGDIALGTLALNQLSNSIGCSAPRTVSASPTGMFFMSADGIRQVTQSGIISDANSDLFQPFANAINPSRACAAWNNSVYRISINTTTYGNISSQDLWLDTIYGRWNGPHTFTYDMVVPYHDKFLLSSSAHPGVMYLSQVVSSNALFIEGGSTLACVMQSMHMNNADPMSEKLIIESTIEVNNQFPQNTYNVTCLSEEGDILNIVSIINKGTAPIWGTMIWGQFTWSSSSSNPKTFLIPWTEPIVYKQLTMTINVSASSSIGIHSIMNRTNDLGYTLK